MRLQPKKKSLDIDDLLYEAESSARVEYRNPLASPHADPKRMTRSQEHAWRFLHANQGKGPKIGMIGAKGSGKTHFGSAFAYHMGQKYPESMGCVISNTYTQAKDNAGALIMKLGKTLGYSASFFQSKTVNGRPYSSLFVIDLDGKGYDDGKRFYILVRSFEAVNKLEGIELDWLWCEEIQDAAESEFKVVITRVRGQNADNSVFVAGMPEDEIHWMYRMLPQIGFVEENTLRQAINVAEFVAKDGMEVVHEPEVDLVKAGSRGVLFEPTVFENQRNLPPTYIPDLRATLDEELAERWIYGRRTSLGGNRVAHNYEDHQHRLGRMPKVLARYDKNLPITLCIDFNVSPLCATVWQEKGWNDKWNAPNIGYDSEADEVYETIFIENDDGSETHEHRELEGFHSVAAPNRTVLAQVDEFEIWEGGTRGLMRAFVERYRGHRAGGRVLGDSTGSRRQTSSETTDWDIIVHAMQQIPDMEVSPGVEIKSNYKTGEVTYINPPRRDTFNVLNAALKDSNGQIHVCFLPKSDLASGGAAASVHKMSYRGDGTVDDTADRRPASDKKAIRTHFFDTVRYVVWDFRGGLVTPEHSDWDSDDVYLDDKTFNSGRFEDDWGGLF